MPDPTTCTLCKSGTPAWNGACRDCLTSLGFKVPVPAIDPPRTGCARCGHRTLIRCLLRERTLAREQRDTLGLEAASVTFGYGKTVPMFGAGRPTENPAKPYGPMEARICKACGFTDLYTQQPEEIPIGPAYGTEEITVPEDAPYR